MSQPDHATREAEASALKLLMELHWRKSQVEFAQLAGIKNQGQISQWLNNIRPINLKAGIKLTRALGVDLDQLSPRLAAEAARASESVPERHRVVQSRESRVADYNWPFSTLERARYDALPTSEQEIIEALLLKRVVEWERAHRAQPRRPEHHKTEALT